MTKIELINKTLNFEKTPHMPVCGICVTKEFLLDVISDEKDLTKYNAREIYFKAMKKLDVDIILQYVLPFPERYDNEPEASVMPVNHKFN